ncbi:hypothetical protein AB1Y20_004733 [Prymnesium parvum]|uniref:Reverse transcriptase Ty1/copia-type domain-containing protein n=1 Tax=Prymnesium parvum TaxID=97485 RepID=A0AB34IXR6_PRYPA
MCYIGFVAGAPYTWKMQRAKWTTLSSAESEYFAQTAAVMTLQAHEPLFKFLDLKVTLPIISFCDNETAVRVADEDYSTKRMKHVRTRMAFLKEAIKRQLVMLVHIDTAGNVADIGTKPLGAAVFHRLREFLVWA